MKVLVSIIVPILYYAWRRKFYSKKYPPGPKRLPLLGNFFDIPERHAHEKYAQYSKDLDSDIIYLDAAGTPFVVLNSTEACIDLLEKRSAIYSSRYHQTMGYELIDGVRVIAMQPYGNEWRESRRIMVKYLSAPDQAPILSVVTTFVHKSLMPNLLMTPNDFLTHVRNGVGGSILHLTYGLRIKRVNNPWIALAEAGMHCLLSALVPGKYLVDIFPILKHLPEWFPGAQFQKEAKEWKKTVTRFFDEPLEAAKKGMVNGTVQPSFVSRSLEEAAEQDDKERLERMIANIGGTMTSGGNDTSVTSVINFIIVLLLFPDVQAKAQAEIDAVIGPGRLPVLEDKPSLPYLNAVIKEVLRWKPVGPAGLPHMTSEEDIYRGYFIPKGAIVIGNTWAIMHDEKNFPNPSKFDPERFLTPTGQLLLDTNILDPEVVATFGFGRRKCPGSSFGLATFWLSAACILSCFDITPEVDEKGEPIPPEIEYLGTQIVSNPEPFKCCIKPRSEQAVALIQEHYDETSEYII